MGLIPKTSFKELRSRRKSKNQGCKRILSQSYWNFYVKFDWQVSAEPNGANRPRNIQQSKHRHTRSSMCTKLDTDKTINNHVSHTVGKTDSARLGYC